MYLIKKTILQINIILLMGATLFASSVTETLEDNGFYNAAKTVYMAEKIKIINSKEKLDEVKSLYQTGEQSWFNSKYAKLNFTLPSSDKIYYFGLIDSVVNYTIRTKQYSESITYLIKGMDVAYEYAMFNKYYEYASILNDIYLQLGLFNHSWKHLENVVYAMNDLYEYIDFDSAKTSSDILMVHFAQLKLKMDTVIASNNLSLISYNELNQEFNNLLSAYTIDPRLEFFDFSSTNVVAFMNANGVSKNTLEQSRSYTNIFLLKDFLYIYNMYGDTQTSTKILKTLNHNYFANIGFKDDATMGAKRVVQQRMAYDIFNNFFAPFDGSEEKIAANYKRYPLQNELWYQLNIIRLNILNNELEKAYLQLPQAQRALNELIKNYRYLDAYLQDIDKLEKEKYDFAMLKAEVLEKTARLDDAKKIYLTLIAENEKLRDSIPVELRKNFFNGLGKNAYLGLIRINTKIYEISHSKEDFQEILQAINNIQARQLKELSQSYTNTEVTLKELQTRLGTDELIYILFDVDDALVIATISNKKEDAKLYKKSKEFDNSLIMFKDKLVQEYQYDVVKMKQISSVLFEQLQRYNKIKKLHILSDGIASILPFDIYLGFNEQMLFNSYIIDNLSTLDFQQLKQHTQMNKAFLGIADPDYHRDTSSLLSEYFIQLPETRDEVKQASASFSNKKLLFGPDAKESTFKNMDLKQYQFIHFATHGILSGELKEVNEPALVLSSENNEDGFLSASEIARLHMNSEITVLSACNTGNGKYFRGEGLSGIGRAFKIAGSKNLLVSLWPVDSIATQKLMEEFYQNLQRTSNYAVALHEAKQTLQSSEYKDTNTQRGLKLKSAANEKSKLNGYKNPYFWSAFVLITN